MTQTPDSGHGAPVSTDIGSAPAGSTAWGSTSTSAGSTQYGRGNAPSWNVTPPPSHAEAPTTTVPPMTGPPVGAPVGPPVGPPPGQPGEPRLAGPSRASRPRGPRRARLQLRHINPWTVLKFSCVLSIALFFVWLIVIGVLFGVLDGTGVIHKINNAYTTIQGANSSAPVTAGVVFGGAAIIGIANVVLFIALSTVGSVVYNLCADLVGGIEITLSER
jgi:hypothetical protein